MTTTSAVSGLFEPPERVLTAVARALRIVDHKTGETSPWVPNSEQKGLWDACHKHHFVYVLKPRQIGASTAICLSDLLFTALNDAAGHKVRTALIWDTDEKVRDKIALIKDFASQLRLKFHPAVHELVFPNGSKIQGVTAGGRRAGASLSFHRIHASELPFWQDAERTMLALRPALNLNGRFIIETTMGLGQQIATSLYREPNRFHKLFFPVEEHEEYRADPASLTPDVEDWLTDEGFTRRDTMAFLGLVYADMRDKVEVLREYPNRPEHCFQSAYGRWIRVTPRVLDHRPLHVGDHALKVFREPSTTSGQISIGVDTAGGLDRDRSAISVVDKRDGALCASFVDALVTIDDLVKVVRAAFDLYTRKEAAPYQPFVKDPPPTVPDVLVETNGIGLATLQTCHRYGIPAREVTTTEDTRYAGLLAVKRAVEDGKLEGPLELADEADSLYVEDGKFQGKKDLCMASGFVLNDLARNPYKPPATPEDKRIIHLEKALQKANAGKQWWKSGRF